MLCRASSQNFSNVNQHKLSAHLKIINLAFDPLPPAINHRIVSVALVASRATDCAVEKVTTNNNYFCMQHATAKKCALTLMAQWVMSSLGVDLRTRKNWNGLTINKSRWQLPRCHFFKQLWWKNFFLIGFCVKSRLLLTRIHDCSCVLMCVMPSVRTIDPLCMSSVVNWMLMMQVHSH